MTLSRKVCYAALLLLAFLTVSFVFLSLSSRRDGLLTVTVLDIGQGDAIFIKAPNGAQFIIDGGPADNLVSKLPTVMPFFDRSIDGIMVTNPDTDHYSGFLSVLGRYWVGKVVEAGTKSDTPTYAALEKSIIEHNIVKTIARRGMRIVLDREHGVYIQILFPDRDVSDLSSNDGSIVAKLMYGDTSVMLQGDSPAKIEQYLLSIYSKDLDADILKLGHHGSKTSTLPDYVKAVSPKYVVASLGKGNRYGHPHQKTIDTLSKLNIPFLRTDKDGSVTFVSDGKIFTLKN